MSPPQYLTVAEVADRWRCSRDTVYRLVKDRQLAAFRFAGIARIELAEVERYERARTTTPTRRLRGVA